MIDRRMGQTTVLSLAILLAASIAPQVALSQTAEVPATVQSPESATQPAQSQGEAAQTAPATPTAPAPATETQGTQTPPAEAQTAPTARPAANSKAPGTTTSPTAPATPEVPAAATQTEIPVTPAQPETPTAQPAEQTPATTAAPAEPQAIEADAATEATDILSQAFSAPRDDLPHDLSPMGMFMAADWVVKAVMISLAFASLVTWTVWVAKSLQMAGARGRANGALKRIADARTLQDAIQAVGKRRGVVPLMLQAAHEEIKFSDAAIDQSGGDGVKERVSSALSRIEVRAGRRMSQGTGVLATIGSTSPFVGLFGTVWGIMNSFIGISESNTTNLAVVAPGIAEALLATAIGLVAAIPAVIIYNVFARSITGYRQLLGDGAAHIERLVSRDLDFRKVPGTTASSKIKLVTE